MPRVWMGHHESEAAVALQHGEPAGQFLVPQALAKSAFGASSSVSGGKRKRRPATATSTGSISPHKQHDDLDLDLLLFDESDLDQELAQRGQQAERSPSPSSTSDLSAEDLGGDDVFAASFKSPERPQKAQKLAHTRNAPSRTRTGRHSKHVAIAVAASLEPKAGRSRSKSRIPKKNSKAAKPGAVGKPTHFRGLKPVKVNFRGTYYPASIVSMRCTAEDVVEYLIHYHGWAKRFDAWVERDQIKGKVPQVPGTEKKQQEEDDEADEKEKQEQEEEEEHEVEKEEEEQEEEEEEEEEGEQKEEEEEQQGHISDDGNRAIFEVREKVRAWSRGGWYEAVVLKVHATKSECRVHFKGWKASYDTWITTDLLRHEDEADEAKVGLAPVPNSLESLKTKAAEPVEMEVDGEEEERDEEQPASSQDDGEEQPASLQEDSEHITEAAEMDQPQQQAGDALARADDEDEVEGQEEVQQQQQQLEEQPECANKELAALRAELAAVRKAGAEAVDVLAGLSGFVAAQKLVGQSTHSTLLRLAERAAPALLALDSVLTA